MYVLCIKKCNKNVLKQPRAFLYDEIVKQKSNRVKRKPYLLQSSVSGKEDNENTIEVTVERWTTEISADFKVYADGETSCGLLDGGAGVVVSKENST